MDNEPIMKNIDLDQPRAIPEAFLESHYSQWHVMEALGMDEPEFWAAYAQGLIPRGASLMALTGVPLIVWPKALLDEWNKNGRPAEPGALELQNQVLHSLIEAYEGEGLQFPTITFGEWN